MRYRRRLMGSVGRQLPVEDWLKLSCAASLSRSSQGYEHLLRGFLGTTFPGLVRRTSYGGMDGGNGGAILQSQRSGLLSLPC